MLRSIHLEGGFGKQFGKSFKVEANTFRDALRCINCNVSGMKKYLLDCEAKGIGFVCEIAGKPLESKEDLLMTAAEGDMTIIPIPAGAKSGAGKILAAIAIAAIVYASAGTALGVTSLFNVSAATAANLTLAGYTLAINLALTGIQQIMAPDPATDNDTGAESYLFSGSQQNIIEGDPVPLLYGELRVPGRPISFETLNQDYTTTSPTKWGSFSGIRI